MTSAASTSSPPARTAPLWKKALPYFGTLLIFALIFWRIPIAQVGAALEQAPVLKFAGVFLPFSAFYWMIDSLCLTWVVRRFNAPLRFRDIIPIRATMYVLALVNTNLGQGGVAWYVHRKARVPFLEVLSSILFIALLEVYQLFLFSTLGVILYRPGSPAQAGAIAGTFLAARPLDYAIVLGIKAPSFLGSLLAQYFALSLYRIAIPFVKLVLFLPLVFLAAALPIAVAHLGASQAAWLLFFSGNAPGVQILAYSLAAHFTFMFCNGLIGLFFLPRASRELTSLEDDSGAVAISG